MKVLLTTLILFFAFATFCVAQETTPRRVAPPQAEKVQPKGEVDLALEQLKNRNETVLNLLVDQISDSGEQITDGVLNNRAIKLVLPSYPAGARSAHISGEVLVVVIIDKDGKVMAAQVIDGDPSLRAAAIKAAKASRFSSMQIGGKPVNALGKIIYNFVLP